MIFTPFRMTVAWRSQRMASTCCHSPACRSPLLHLADACAPCAAAKRPMTNLKRPMTKRHGPHDQNKTPHDETTWIARVKLNAIFPVSVGTDPAKARESIHLIKHSQCVFNLSQFSEGSCPQRNTILKINPPPPGYSLCEGLALRVPYTQNRINSYNTLYLSEITTLFRVYPRLILSGRAPARLPT